MKKVLTFITVLAFATAAFSQEKPLTQSEYVKMLYALQKSSASKAEIVDALRKRGIDFVLTDGVRSLTRSKGANDEELKRALEEAARRHNSPSTAKPPTPAEAAQLIAKTRSNTLAAVEEMPDFVVKQQIQRSAAYAGTNNFRNLDRLVVAVSYKSSGEETYRVLSNNGVTNTNAQAKGSYEETGGTSSTGEFVTMLATIFKPESESRFEAVDTDLIRGRRAVVYDFSVTRDKAKQVITATGYHTDSTITGMKGRMWVDRDDFRVLRVESEATEIPESFPITSAKRVIDYDWTTISQEKYLLPLISDVRLTFRENSKIYETRNLIRFKEYQKYGTDVQIVEEDNAPPEEAPQKP